MFRHVKTHLLPLLALLLILGELGAMVYAVQQNLDYEAAYFRQAHQAFFHFSLFLTVAMVWRERMTLKLAASLLVGAFICNLLGVFDEGLHYVLRTAHLYPFPSRNGFTNPQLAKLSLFAIFTPALVWVTVKKPTFSRFMVLASTLVVLSTTYLFHWATVHNGMKVMEDESQAIAYNVAKAPDDMQSQLCQQFHLTCVNIQNTTDLKAKLEYFFPHKHAFEVLQQYGSPDGVTPIQSGGFQGARFIQKNYTYRQDNLNGAGVLVIEDEFAALAQFKMEISFAGLAAAAHAFWTLTAVLLSILHESPQLKGAFRKFINKNKQKQNFS